MGLKLPAAGIVEGRVAREVKFSDPDQRQEPIHQYLSLHGLDIIDPFLLLPSSGAEEGVEDRGKTLVIDCE